MYIYMYQLPSTLLDTSLNFLFLFIEVEATYLKGPYLFKFAFNILKYYIFYFSRHRGSLTFFAYIFPFVEILYKSLFSFFVLSLVFKIQIHWFLIQIYIYASSRLGSGYKHKFWQIYGKKIILSTKNAKYFFSDYRKGLQWSRGCLKNIKFLCFFPVREGRLSFLDLNPNSGSDLEPAKFWTKYV